MNVNLAQLLRLRVTFHTLPLFYLRAYSRKNYARVEIHLNPQVLDAAQRLSST